MIPELYDDNLTTLKHVLKALEDVSHIDGVFQAEIRVKVDDVESWAVIGWGEAGEPCVLRFEYDEPEPEPLVTKISPNIHINPTTIPFPNPKQFTFEPEPRFKAAIDPYDHSIND